MKSVPPKVVRTPNSWLKTNSTSIAASRGGGVFEIQSLEVRPGLFVFQVSGPNASAVFANEPGGHRWQRIPPTERKGRYQTSTVTVAVLPDPESCVVELKDGDLEWTTTRGSGPGGQNRNKVETCVVVKHKPSGLVVRCETERSQWRNKQLALGVLKARLQQRLDEATHLTLGSERKNQVGSGMRGDKRRTIRTQDGAVKDHITGKTWRYSDYVAGNW